MNKTKVTQVTICNGAIQAEKANQRVQLSYPAYDWAMMGNYFILDFIIFFNYAIARSPFAYVNNSKKHIVLAKTTDFPESFSLN